MQPDFHVHFTNTPTKTQKGETVVIFIRPDPDSFRPHNLALLKPAAERLLADLQKPLARISLLLLLPLVAGGGCSGHVEVSTETRSPSETMESVEKFDTKVNFSLLTDGDRPLLPQPAPEPSEPPKSEEGTVEITGDGNVVVAVEGDVHIHGHRHTHLHVEDRSKPEPSKARSERIKIEVYRPKIDPECERLRRQYEEKVREWKALMNR